MITINHDEAVPVTRDIYWVGFYDKETNLQCNPYLIVDEGSAVLLDPGSIPYFPNIMRKVIDLVDPASICALVLSHQDPDVCGSLAVLEEVIGRQDLDIIAHNNTIRLISHYGLKSRCYAADEHDFRYILPSGRTLQFLFTPYLHSPGVIMTYDTKSRSLFTGDVFGAISNNWTLFASAEGMKEPMKAWHQAYVPNNRVLRDCMQRLEKLPIDRLLPQHGSILEGGNVSVAIDYLKQLPCGLDLENLQL